MSGLILAPCNLVAGPADAAPAQCSSFNWTCVASAGSSCTAGPVAGSIADLVDLQVGGTATYSANCTVNPATAPGTVISNTATVAGPGGAFTEINPANNSATDTTTVDSAAIPVVVSVPTLSGLGLLILSSLLAMVGLGGRSRRRA